MAPTPGSGGVPYTHREIFLAAENYVGKGLNTYAKAIDSSNDYPPLNEKQDFQSIVDDLDTLFHVRDTDALWDELIQSEVVKKLAESEFTVEYLAKVRGDIDQNLYQDVKDFIEYSNLIGLSKQSIRWVLAVKLTHVAIYNDDDLLNRLLQDNEDWMDVLINLTTEGNLVEDNKLEFDTILMMLTHAVDRYGEDPYAIFSDESNLNSLLKSSNKLDNNPVSVPSFSEGFIQSQNQRKNLSFNSSTFSTSRWRSSSYSNSRAIGLINRDERIRCLIAQGRLGLNDPNFRFTDLFDGTVLDNFWDFDWDAEFYQSARASSNYGRNDSDRRRYLATGNISTSNSLQIAANSAGRVRSNYNRLATPERARLRTHNFSVEDKETIAVSVSGGKTEHDFDDYNGRRYSYRSRTARSQVTINVGNDSKRWRGGETPESVTFDVTNANNARIDIDVQADNGGSRLPRASPSLEVHADASIEIDDITIE